MITKADATITVTGYNNIYDGDPHGASGSAKGVKNETLAGLDLGEQFTNVPGGAANWVFTDVTGNYNNAAGSVSIVISKANATINVTGYNNDYDGDPHGASGSAKGVKNETLAGLNLGAQFTDVPGGTAHWVFTDVTGNYHDASGDVAIIITKADAIIVVTPYTVTWDGLSHTATGSATGAKGETLTALLDLTGTTHTNPGIYNDTWTFAGNSNYNSDSGNVTDTINYKWSGFFQPINTDVRNNVKAGSAVPMKFSLGGNFGLGIFQDGYPGWIYITASTNGDDVEETVTAGGSSLTYDPVAKQYIYVLKTDKAWAGKSVRIYMRFIDGTEKYADFNCMR